MENQSEVLNNFSQTDQAITPESIVKTLLRNDEAQNMRAHLRTMLDTYLLYEEGLTQFQKFEMYGTFKALDDALQSMEQIEKVK